MKKAIALSLSILMLLSLCACGGSSNSSTPAAEETTEATAPEVAPEAAESGNPYQTASGWPTKGNITLIVPAGAGGTMDLSVRVMAAELEKELGTTVVVENVPGGGMWIGWLQCANSAPDGYTFSVYNYPAVAIANYNEANPHEEGPANFTKLVNQQIDYGALAIRVDDPRYSDLDSFVAYAQENTVICTAGAKGLANGDASSAEWFNINCNTNIEIMSHDSSSDGMARFYAGDTDCFFGSVGDLLGEMDAGIYKVIAVFSDTRSDLMPEVPTTVEQGYDYVNFVGRGYAFPAGVDQEIVDNMTAALIKACEASEEKLLEFGIETMIVSGDDLVELEQSQLVKRLAIYGLTLDDKVVG